MPSWLLPTVGAVTVFGVLLALGLYLYGTIRDRWTDIADYLDPGNKIDLSYLPPDADCYIVLRPAALRRAGSVDAFVESARYREGVEPAFELLGVSPDNVASATCGAVGFGRQLEHLLAGEARAPRFVTVIRTIEPIERITASEPLVAGEEISHGSRSYVRIHASTADASQPTLAVFVPNAHTVVYGSEDEVRAAIEHMAQGTPPPRRTELDFVNPEHQVIIIALSDAVAASAEGTTAQTNLFPANFTEFVAAIDRSPDRSSTGLTFTGDEITIEVKCQFANSVERDAFAARVEQIRTEAREQLAAGPVTGDSRGWEAISVGEHILDRLRVASDLDSVTVSAIAPLDTLIARDRLRVHVLTMAPFDLALEEIPRLMLGVETGGRDD